MAAHGSRSRDGCSNCRRRKRRCDESKPVCLTCQRTGADCIYPVPGSASNPLKFVVATSHHHIIPAPGAGKSRFLHLSSAEIPAICLPGGRDSSDQPDGPRLDLGSIPRQISLFQGTGRLCAVEPALMQYYAEVISSSRVYVSTDRNLFRTSVMPRVLLHQGPLLFTVLALSAAEWAQNVVVDGRNYNLLSARYKVQALHELQSCLGSAESTEENLLTCVLLASLEIADGSRPTWLRHLLGALALLDNFSTSIDPAVAKFVLQYFRFRYILMETTQPRISDPDDPYHRAMSRVAQAEYTLPIRGVNLVDVHIGCSMELVDIINHISALSLAAGPRREMSMVQRQSECRLLEQRILKLCPEIDMGNEYLLKSAESFQVAAQIYLRLTCLDAEITHASILEPHAKLLRWLSEIIVEGQPRRSFPMWPLFIAGCACSSDQRRKTVIGLFSILDGQWPLSNISAIWNAVRTVWHTRDLATPMVGKQDWQEVIHKFGWKLALT